MVIMEKQMETEMERGLETAVKGLGFKVSGWGGVFEFRI